MLKKCRFPLLETYIKQHQPLMSIVHIDGRNYIRIPKSITEYQIHTMHTKMEQMKTKHDVGTKPSSNEKQNVKKPRRYISIEEMRQSKGIRETTKSYKSCEHCLYLNLHKFCGVHNIHVELDNTCSRIVIPKTYLGGAFSPR
jgi:hypothetical protein